VLPMPTLMSGQQCCFNDVASCQKELIVMLDVKSLVSQEEQAAIRKMISDNTSEK
jgi:purine-binding chemotaxis protein CheW